MEDFTAVLIDRVLAPIALLAVVICVVLLQRAPRDAVGWVVSYETRTDAIAIAAFP